MRTHWMRPTLEATPHADVFCEPSGKIIQSAQLSQRWQARLKFAGNWLACPVYTAALLASIADLGRSVSGMSLHRCILHRFPRLLQPNGRARKAAAEAPLIVGLVMRAGPCGPPEERCLRQPIMNRAALFLGDERRKVLLDLLLGQALLGEARHPLLGLVVGVGHPGVVGSPCPLHLAGNLHNSPAASLNLLLHQVKPTLFSPDDVAHHDNDMAMKQLSTSCERHTGRPVRSAMECPTTHSQYVIGLAHYIHPSDPMELFTQERIHLQEAELKSTTMNTTQGCEREGHEVTLAEELKATALKVSFTPSSPVPSTCTRHI